MHNQESRPTSPPEKSLQFMAWNHKGIDEKLGSYLPQIAGYMQAQSRAMDRMATALEKLAKMSTTGKTSADDQIPF